ncbi:MULTISPECIES: hypothetical protein [unclassified Paenibacillus]|uniref:hypothetical protein n=1 Tax=unclassified Paenibacillus TaxID=185978 RepID=UPI001C123FA2|nr:MULTISPECIES: hypothetical protein [unclassified Paenibacillus]MBU5444083.1 hypothetical protein [Paenibacillus sp. MSJ-34]CAH0118690.1 hypothetical protein PAE9249_01182 [Paenibacillus sp. CECT 9249]
MEKFDLRTTIKIRNQLDQMHVMLMTHAQDGNPNLLRIVDNLCGIAAMFADMKVQELKGDVQTPDPQDYIQKKLSLIRSELDTYFTHSKV